MDQLKAAWHALSPAQRAAIGAVLAALLALVAFCTNVVSGGNPSPGPTAPVTKPPASAPPDSPRQPSILPSPFPTE